MNELILQMIKLWWFILRRNSFLFDSMTKYYTDLNLCLYIKIGRQYIGVYREILVDFILESVSKNWSGV